jgi:hypothetical protein
MKDDTKQDDVRVLGEAVKVRHDNARYDMRGRAKTSRTNEDAENAS